MSREREERIDRLLGEWADGRRRGDGVSADDLVREHPDIADELRAGIETMRRIDHAMPGGAGGVAPRERIGEYRILREIGRGGMGVVYEAEQDAMQRRVALKVLYPSITNSAQSVERFRREARAAGGLKHTNIVTVHQLGEDEGAWFCAMELVDGHSLDRVLEDVRRLRPAPRGGSRRRSRAPSSGAADTWRATTGERRYFQRVAEMFAEIADALQLAHDHGVVHRDVKPANLMVSSEGQLKILDFGLARIRDESTGLTVTGGIVGTLSYMSPEQAGSGEVDARTDVYSLGATVYEVLTLRPPFHAKDVAEILQKLRVEDPRQPSRMDRRIPRDLETIVLKALEKEPSRRYASARDMARDLRAFAEGRTIEARRAGRLLRTWRLAQRHKVRTALTAGLVVALTGAAMLARLQKQAEAERDREHAELVRMEYERLLEAADLAKRDIDSEEFGDVNTSANALYSQAIELSPARPEAYFGRALAWRTRHMSDALSDIDAAVVRGLPDSKAHLARAFVFFNGDQRDKAIAEQGLVIPDGHEDPESLSLRAVIADVGGRTDEAAALADQAIETAGSDRRCRRLALITRCNVRGRRGQFEAALQDAMAFRSSLGPDEFVPSADTTIARLWLALGRRDAADAQIEQAIAATTRVGTLDAWQRLCRADRGDDWATRWRPRITERAIAAFPDDPTILVQRAAAVMAWDEKIPLLDRALAKEPTLHGALCLKGQALFELRRFDEALEVLHRAEASFECHVTLREIARAIKALGHDADAWRYYDRACELEPGDAETPAFYAQDLLGGGRAADALGVVDRALKAVPRDFQLHVLRAVCLGRLDRGAQAREEYESASRLADPDPGRHAMLAWDLAVTNVALYDDASKECRRALELLPADDASRPFVASLLAKVTRLGGHPAEALRVLAEQPASAARDPAFLEERMYACRETGDAQGALENCDALLRIEPSARAHGWRGQLLGALGRPDAEVVEEFRQALATPDHPPERRHQVGSTPMPTVMGAFDVPSALNAVAWSLATTTEPGRRDASRAVDLAREAATRAPENGAIWNTYGVALVANAQYEQSLDALQKSMALRGGGDANDWFFVAIAERHLGHDAKAREWFDKAVAWTAEHDPKNEELDRFQRESAEVVGVAITSGAAPAPAK